MNGYVIKNLLDYLDAPTALLQTPTTDINQVQHQSPLWYVSEGIVSFINMNKSVESKPSLG